LLLYKKLKKRIKAKDLNRSDKDSFMPAKKLNLGVVILGFLKKMERVKKARETY
jgi:hypothetical protein